MVTVIRGSASGSPANRSPTRASPPVSTTYGVASCSRSSAVTQSAAKLSDTIIDPAIAEMARIGAASATGVRTAVRTWSRASRADTSRPANGRPTSEARPGKIQPPRQ